MRYIGLDIGGTKCAVSLGEVDEGIRVLQKRQFSTAGLAPDRVLDRFASVTEELLGGVGCAGIGISCGGPLDSRSGVVLGPPNLPGWEEVHVTEYFERRFGCSARLQNDANACAVAEWKYGAGRGYRNLIFLTFGTGLGAGLILDGRLYVGANDNAGETGHIRLAATGPVGYGKAGSFEGFCSGGGIARLARSYVEEELGQGKAPSLVSYAGGVEDISTRHVAELAREGDPLCQRVFAVSGEKLGYGLSILVDILNPEAIIIGGVFMRCQDLLRPPAERVMRAECLPASRKACVLLGAGLGEQIGDYAALAVAAMGA